LASLGLCVGAIGMRAGGDSGQLLWRLGFFATLGAGLSLIPPFLAAWRGRAHLAMGWFRDVPFRDDEFRADVMLSPRVRAYGVIGHGALVGAALVVISALVWLAGLAFTPAWARGRIDLSLGEASRQLTLCMSITTCRCRFCTPWCKPMATPLSPAFRPEDTRDGRRAGFELTRGDAALLETHRVSLAQWWQGPPLGLKITATSATGETAQFDLWAGNVATVGEWSWQFEDATESFLNTAMPAYRVREQGPDGSRSVWLIPDAPNLDVDHHEGAWHLAVQGFVGSPRVSLALSERWLWWWRVTVLLLAGTGAFLLLLVPHRSWVWLGVSGDRRLRVWSLNQRSRLHEWSDHGLQQALGEKGFADEAGGRGAAGSGCRGCSKQE
jgi:hypothetical protein